MRLLVVLLLVAFIGGCSDAPAKPRAARKERIEAAEVELAKTPRPRTYRYGDGELRVLDVPAADSLGFVERQRCFIWRDETFKTAAISCPQPPEPVIGSKD